MRSLTTIRDDSPGLYSFHSLHPGLQTGHSSGVNESTGFTALLGNGVLLDHGEAELHEYVPKVTFGTSKSPLKVSSISLDQSYKGKLLLRSE